LAQRKFNDYKVGYMGIFRKTTTVSSSSRSDLTQSLFSFAASRRMKVALFVLVFGLTTTGCTSNDSTAEEIIKVAPNCESALQGFSLHESEDNPGYTAWYVDAAEATLEACRSYDWIAWVEANRSDHLEIEDYVYYSDTAPILSLDSSEAFLEVLCDNYLESNGTPALACS
jgi:hypothetical protein